MLNVTDKRARQRLLAESIRIQIRLERSLAKRVTPLLDRQARLASKVFRQTGDSSLAEVAINSFKSQWEKVLTSHLKRTGIISGNRTFATLQQAKDEQTIFLDALSSWVRRQGAARVVKIQETTRTALQSAILAGQQAGDGQQDIAKRIVDKISGAGRLTAQARARTIARTETHNAFVFAGDEAAKSTGLTLEREWISNDDERTRTADGNSPFDHVVVDGQRRGMDEPFDVGGEKLIRPGDPEGSAGNVINCRCGIGFHAML